MKFLLLIGLSLSLHASLYAQLPGSDMTKIPDSDKPVQVKPAADTKDKQPSNKTTEKEEAKDATKLKNTATVNTPDDVIKWSRLIAVIGLLVIMAGTIIYIFGYVKNRESFIGHDTIKLIGFVLLLPSVCVVSLISPESISGPALAALLGTIAGYVLSRSQENDKDGGKNNPASAAIDKAGAASEVGALKTQVATLTKEITDLKAKLPQTGN